MSFLPEQRFGSQWPRSQQAALKGGLERPDVGLVADEGSQEFWSSASLFLGGPLRFASLG